jgi:hypothetical protein
MVQIYADEHFFMDALGGFVGAGLRRNEGVIVIATATHLHELEKRLRAEWIDVDRARWEDRYVAVLAQETLSRFMAGDSPDAALFEEVASALLARARGPDNRAVRAFGEMVAVLWGQGNPAAAIKLEQLWNAVQAEHGFPLFCAYPRSGFHRDALGDIQAVCNAHTRVLPGYA